MALDDRHGPDLDPNYAGIVAIFNATNQSTTQTLASHAPYTLHPVQANGTDPIVRASTYNPATGTFTVPPAPSPSSSAGAEPAGRP